MRRRQGMTLVEVLVAVLLMGLFTTMVATAMVSAYRNYHLSADKLVLYRTAVNALDRMARRLAVCRQIESPSVLTQAVGPYVAPVPAFTPTAANPLVFSYFSHDAGGLVTVGYAFDGTDGKLIEYDYPTPPASPPVPTYGRTMATNLNGLTITPQALKSFNDWTVLQLSTQVVVRQGNPLPVDSTAVLENVGAPLP